MIELYFAPTPNGWKITIMLEECGLPYQVKLINIGAGEQFEADFLAISPNAKMPAIIDHQPLHGEAPFSLFESGSILLYLAEKSGQFIPQDKAGHYRVQQWLFWQMANLGPMGGQVSHFLNYAPDGNEYSKQRYLNEYDRLLAVMNYQLERNHYLAGKDYSIADMASFPWLLPYKRYGFDLEKFQHVKRWYDELKQRPALRRGVDVGKDWRPKQAPDESMKAVLFNQNSDRYRQ